MTVIIDALKAAQRERARRHSSAVPTNAAPILVPLRSRPLSASPTRRMLLLVGGGVALIALSFGARSLLQSPGKPSALPTVPAITSTILAEALADSGARTVPEMAPRAMPDETSPAVGAFASPMQAVGREPAAAVAQRDWALDTTAIPQGEPREAPKPGRLRIAVENVRQPQTTRLFADAVAAQRAGDASTARRLYDRVLAVTPNDPDALNNLGVLLSAQRDYARALDLLRRASAVSPRNPGPWNNIGALFHAQGKHEDAIAAFRQALSFDAHHPGAKVGLAQQYLAISAPDQARALLSEVVAANPQLPEAHYTLGQVLELQGDRSGAVRAYNEFVRVAPPRLAEHVQLVKRRIELLSGTR
jgi:Tfp pilus assembly protein PilF